jgi:hypothetical protein
VSTSEAQTSAPPADICEVRRLSEVLRAGIEGPCLVNWLMRQRNAELKLVYKAAFISKKGKATARAV